MTHSTSGAALQSAVPTPTLDLATLVANLVAALPSATNPLLGYDYTSNCLHLNPSAVLRRLPNQIELLHADLDKTAGQTVRIGGRIVPGTELALRNNLVKLEEQLQAEFDALCTTHKLSPRQLVVTDVKAEFEGMGKRVGGYPDRWQDQALTRLQALNFVDPLVHDVSKEDRVGRVMSVTETVQAGDRLEILLQKVGLLMQRDSDNTAEEISKILDDLRNNYKQGDKHLQYFTEFLDHDGAGQARIRLAVSFDMMEAIQRIAVHKQDDAAQLAAEYIRRVLVLYRNFTLSMDNDLELDLAQHYNLSFGAKFLLSTALSNNYFYSCLPVWCQWDTSLLEILTPTIDDTQELKRQVSYHFKINGKDAESGKTAFTQRLQSLREDLLPEQPLTDSNNITKSLAQLVTLAVVIPHYPNEMDVDVTDSVRKYVDDLNRDGKRAIENLLADLATRTDAMQKIARAVITILKQPKVIMDELSRHPHSYYLNILPGILNPAKAFNGTPEPLNIPEGQNWQVAFLSQVRVTVGQPWPGALFSLTTEVALKESLLCADSSEIFSGQMQRTPPRRLMQIIWHQPKDKKLADKWRLAASIAVTYDTSLLGTDDPKPRLNAVGYSQLALRRTAFAVLVYMTLKVICTRLNATEGRIPLTASMLRIQAKGRENSKFPFSGDQGLYAISQAIEQALGQYLRTRMQGLTITKAADGLARKNTFNALLSAFPLQLQTPQLPRIEKIGVLTLVSRQVTDHPQLTEDAQKDFVIVGRTYQAQVNNELPGYKLEAGANLLAVESGRDIFTNSSAILQAVRRLYTNGCRHLIYMGHRLGGQQLGRAALRHRHHDHPEFLAKIQTLFPDLHLYPLVHAVFLATRLRQRNAKEDAFEIRNYQAHPQGLKSDFMQLSHQNLIPIYSLATMHVVGKESERPQSGVATYFLLTDPTPERFPEEATKWAELMTNNSSLLHDLTAVLRGIHYLESEAPTVNPTRGKNDPNYVRPVLHPYPVLQPSSIADAGEIIVHPSTKNTGQVLLSLPAILANITAALRNSTESAPPAPHLGVAP